METRIENIKFTNKNIEYGRNILIKRIKIMRYCHYCKTSAIALDSGTRCGICNAPLKKFTKRFNLEDRYE